MSLLHNPVSNTSTKLNPISFTTFHNVISGSLHYSASTHSGTNPTTGTKLWDVPIATKDDVDLAVSSAKKVFNTFKHTSWKHRSSLLIKYADSIKSYATELTNLLILETGKPRFLAEGEIQTAIDTILHFSSLPEIEKTVLDESTSKVVKTTHEPLGVCAAICPWNFPVALPMNKLGPAIQAGNCIILKPSPHAPYTLLKLAEIAQSVFPEGVVQCVGGSFEEELGPWLTSHPDIQKVSFTGSCAVGKKVMSACSETIKRVTLELGGNDATIVCPDIDISSAAAEIALGVFLNTGQVCAATKRLYVHVDIYHKMIEALRCAVAKLKVGGDEGVIGPVQNKMQFERVRGFIELAKKEGYKFAVGNPEPWAGEGFFIEPIIIDNPPENSRLVVEEQFGPILPLLPWTSESDVIVRANNTKFGLSACVWSNDIIRARRIGAELDVGSVYINSFQKPTFQGLFGGHKESGIGTEFGIEGLLEYCNAKSTYINF